MATKTFARYFSEVVRSQRKHKKLSQEMLAERADLSWKMISLVERGERTPSLTVSGKIATGLGMPFWRLIKTAEDLQREDTSKKRR